MDKVYEHTASGGSIYQCGAMEIPGIAKCFNVYGYIHCPVVINDLNDLGFSAIALTSKDFQPDLGTATNGTGIDVLHLPFADNHRLLPDEVTRIKTMLEDGSKRMAQAVLEGKKVLSTCWAGINRSSFLSSYIIRNLEPTLQPWEIINFLRSNRAPHCLNNKLFESIVLSGF